MHGPLVFVVYALGAQRLLRDRLGNSKGETKVKVKTKTKPNPKQSTPSDRKPTGESAVFPVPQPASQADAVVSVSSGARRSACTKTACDGRWCAL